MCSVVFQIRNGASTHLYELSLLVGAAYGAKGMTDISLRRCQLLHVECGGMFLASGIQMNSHETLGYSVPSLKAKCEV